MTRKELVLDLALRISRIPCAHPVRVAIDGVDAAGKTSLADELVAPLERLGRPVIRASIDGFHNPRTVRYRQGSLSPQGYFEDSFDYSAVVDVLLRPLGPGGSRSFCRAAFDVRSDTRVPVVFERAAADAILLFDGVFLLRNELRDHFDFSIFVHADFDVTTRRAEARDVTVLGSVEEVRRRYRDRYVPGQRLYLSSVRPAQRASVVIDNNEPSMPAIWEPQR